MENKDYKEINITNTQALLGEAQDKLTEGRNFAGSMKSNATYAGKEIGINNTDRDSEDDKKEKLLADSIEEDIKRDRGKVYLLNYFDTQTGSYKKILVKKIKNSNSIL